MEVRTAERDQVSTRRFSLAAGVREPFVAHLIAYPGAVVLSQIEALTCVITDC